MIKVMIVDDQELIRESLKVILNISQDINIIDAVPSVAEALKSAARYRPDVVLMDVRMPGMSGIDGTKLLKERYPRMKVIVLTTFDDDAYVFGAMKNGASGYLLKGSDVKELSDAIHIAYSGGAFINPNVASKVIEQFSAMARGSARIQVEDCPQEDIRKNEWQIIRTVGSGMNNREIARELCLSEGTVRNMISRILCKLGLRDRTQLAIWAVQTGAANMEHDI